VVEDKPRIARLTSILLWLQSKRLVTATLLAQKHNVSIRTIYRDIKTLIKSGIPIITEEGKGYSIMDGYNLPPVMFTQEEANALITAEQLVAKNRDQSLIDQYGSAILKIKAVLQSNQKSKTELLAERLQVRSATENTITSNHLILLQTTIARYQLVKIQYTSLHNEKTSRIIEPFALYTTQDNWVLLAYCRLRKAFRAFRLDCIKDLKVLDNYFEPHKMTLKEYLEACQKTTATPDTPLT